MWNFKLCAKKVIKDNVYWPAKISNFKALKIGVHELLELTPVLILMSSYATERPFFMSIELTPKYYATLHDCWKYA